MKRVWTLLLMLSLAPMTSFGQDTSDSCGLGWQVMPDETLVGTFVRATTNFVVPPTFGMTSGTIGCDQHSIAQNEADKANYAVTNFETLKIEMANGNGETLEGFAELMGCDSTNFGVMTKKNYNKIYTGEKIDALEMYKNVRTLVNTNKCSA